jgi:uncharacterized repeat protein (TIGR01451 family)
MNACCLPLLGLVLGPWINPAPVIDPPVYPNGVYVVPLDPPTPAVSLKVRVLACVPPGQEITYKLCVENCTAAPAHHVIVKNEVPKGAKFVRSSPEPHATEPELQWRLGTLGPGCKKDIILILLPEGKDDLKNCARVQFEHGQCVTTRIAASAPAVLPVPVPVIPPVVKPPTTAEPPIGEKPPPGQKLPKGAPPVVGEPKLELTISAPKKQYANLSVKYQLTLSNTGSGKAVRALISATLPANAKFVSASNGGVFLENKVAWILGEVAAGRKKTVTLVYQAQAAGEFCVSAQALADREGAAAGKLTAEAQGCTDFQGVSAVTLNVLVTKNPVEVGDTTSYVITVANPGTAPVTNLNLRAMLPHELELRHLSAVATDPAIIKEKTIQGDKGDPVAAGTPILFKPIPALAPGMNFQVTVLAEGRKAGDVRVKVEMTADQLKAGGPVTEEESTTIFAETERPPVVRPQKRNRNSELRKPISSLSSPGERKKGAYPSPPRSIQADSQVSSSSGMGLS